MEGSRFDEISREFSGGVVTRATIHILIIIVGLGLAVFGYFIDPSSDLVRKFHIDQGSTGVGFVLAGLGFGGLISTITDDRFAKQLIELLRVGVEYSIQLTQQTLRDHVASSHLDLDIPEKFRGIVHMYHQTGVTLGGAHKVIWRHNSIDLKANQSKKRLWAQQIVEYPGKTGSNVTYEFELVAKRDKIITYETNVTDPGECSSVGVFDQPVLSELTCGILSHMDWDGNFRISRAILSTSPLTVKNELDEVRLQEIWEQNFRSKYKYNVDL